MKNLPEMDLWTRKSLLNFGNHSESGDLFRGPTMVQPDGNCCSYFRENFARNVSWDTEVCSKF